MGILGSKGITGFKGIFGAQGIFGPDAPFLSKFPGASVALSLFDLSGGGGSVARVRRSSDSAEQDFTAAQITNGSLLSFTGAGSGFITKLYDQRVSTLESILIPDQDQGTFAQAANTVDGGSLLNKKVEFTYYHYENHTQATNGVFSAVDSSQQRYDFYFQGTGNDSARIFYPVSGGDKQNYREGDTPEELVVGQEYAITIEYGDIDETPQVWIDGVEVSFGAASTASSSVTSKFQIHTIGFGPGSSSYSGNNPIYDLKVYDTDKTTLQHHWTLRDTGDGFKDLVGSADFSVQAGSYDRVKESDTSVVAIDAEQDTADSQPRVVNSGSLETVNGIPMPYCDGTDDFMSLGSPVWTATGTNSNFVVVKSTQESATDADIIAQYDGLALGRTNITVQNDPHEFWYFSNGLESIVVSYGDHTNDLVLLSLVKESATEAKGSINGGPDTSDTGTGVSVLQTPMVIGSNEDEDRNFEGYVGALIVYDEAFSDQQSDAIEVNLIERYNI